MNLEFKGIHYNISDTTKDFFEKKLQRIDFAKDYLMDLTISLIKEPHGYKIEAKLHFQWGLSRLVSVDCFELYEGIESIIDKLELLIRKEKDKIKSH